MNPFQLIIDPYSIKIEVFEGDSLLDPIMMLNPEINVSCGGLGTCGKCLIQNLSTESSLSSITEKEKEILTAEEINQGYRLACQCKIQGNSYIRLTEKILGKPFKKAQIMITQNEALIKKPIIKRMRKKGKNLEIEYGIAFDLGTTTIVGYLVNLQSGKILSIDSMFNPQITIGEDIISRMVFAEKTKENSTKIHLLVKSAFNRIISNLLGHQKIEGKSITEIVIVGNTAMHHLFYELPVNTLGRSPYIPAISDAIWRKRPPGASQRKSQCY